MSAKLKNADVEARMVIYDGIADFLGMEEWQTEEERKQCEIVAKQIKSIADKFYHKYSNKLTPTP